MDDKIRKTFSLGAVDKIMVFGGSCSASSIMYNLSKEGELEEDLSDEALLPGGICLWSYSVEDGKIFALSQNTSHGKWKWDVRVGGSGLFYEYLYSFFILICFTFI